MGSEIASAVSAREQRKASDKAAKVQTRAAQAAIDTEWAMYDQSRADFAPWRETGGRALTSAEKMITEGPGQFDPQKEPGYEFGYKNFIEDPYLSAQSAKGKRLSGQTVKGLTKFAQDYASTSYDNFLARYYQKLNPYLALSGSGQVAASGSSQVAQQTGNQVANLQTSVGNVQAQNAINQGQINAQLAKDVNGAFWKDTKNAVGLVGAFYGKGGGGGMGGGAGGSG